ncbi:MAG: hypothetical protein PHQ24_02025 [Proteiniphilum sp.]|nr:hypothetical protein [Proteiniphilum sp.]MDD4458578.1 hypothetical protein [Proteiniphilum sp.]
MKRRVSFFYFLMLATAILFLSHCTDSKNSPMRVDEVLVNAESLTGKTVMVEGLCTHVCGKSGMKLFLQGSEETLTLRAESDATLGKFDPEAEGKRLRVRGVVMKDSITEGTDHHDHGVSAADSTGTVHCEEEEAAVPRYHLAAISYQILE